MNGCGQIIKFFKKEALVQIEPGLLSIVWLLLDKKGKNEAEVY
jgi:hypothetical protein